MVGCGINTFQPRSALRDDSTAERPKDARRRSVQATPGRSDSAVGDTWGRSIAAGASMRSVSVTVAGAEAVSESEAVAALANRTLGRPDARAPGRRGSGWSRLRRRSFTWGRSIAAGASMRSVSVTVAGAEAVAESEAVAALAEGTLVRRQDGDPVGGVCDAACRPEVAASRLASRCAPFP